MSKIKLTKTMVLPEEEEAIKNESITNKHERWLRILIANNFTPIYIGDKVKVSDRYTGDSKNPHEGKIGIITDLEVGMQAAFNMDYIVYTIATKDKEKIKTYQYTLDRLHQPKGNRLLEQLLRETNSEFETAYRPGSSKK